MEFYKFLGHKLNQDRKDSKTFDFHANNKRTQHPIADLHLSFPRKNHLLYYTALFLTTSLNISV